MKISTFEEAICWQKAKALTLRIYTVFNTNKDFGFRDQIQRAAVSVMNNIAESFERSSNKKFKHFLFIAKGSCGEVRSMVYLAKELHYLSDVEADSLHNESREISKILAGLIKTL